MAKHTAEARPLLVVYRGEKRLLAVDLAAVLATGAALSGSPTVSIVTKRGRAATTLLTSDPAAPVVSGTEVRFWVIVGATETRGNFLALVSCASNNGETVKEEAPLIVQDRKSVV